MTRRAKKQRTEDQHSLNDQGSSLPLDQTIPFPLLPIDEADEYFDPFSSLNRFLLKKTKEAISVGAIEEVPFAGVEQNLLEFILPEFKTLYPKYRLGGHALKRIYETVLYYYNHIRHTPSIFDEEGRLNLFALIRELISQIDLAQSFHSFHPYSFAYRIARQVTECAIILDCAVPPLDYLTKLTWSAMQNLLPRKNIKNHLPHSPFDPIETKLALQSLVLIPSCNTQTDLKEKLFSFILPYQNLQHTSHLKEALLFLGTKVRKPHLSLLKSLPEAMLDNIKQFLTQQMDFYLAIEPKLESSSIIDRTISLYRLSAGINPSNAKAELKEVEEYLSSLKTNRFTPNSATLSSSIYAYVNSELALTKDFQNESTFSLITKRLKEAYELASSFPKLHEDHLEELKVLSYTLLEEKTHFLSSLSPDLQNILLEEITLQYVISPLDSMESIAKECAQKLNFLKKALEACQSEEELKEKAEIISHQGEMVAYFLNPPKSSLTALLKNQIESSPLGDLNKSKETYLNHHKGLIPYEKQVREQMEVISTILSYHQMRYCSRSNYHFFLKRLTEKAPSLEEIEQISHLKLPLIPYRPKAPYSYLKRRPKQSLKE